MKALLFAAALAAAPSARAVAANSGVERAGHKQLQQAAQPAPAEVSDRLSDDDARAQMDAMLGSIDTPIAASQWAALGAARVGPWLEEIARSTSVLPLRRAKAVEGLVAARWERSVGVLRELSRDEAAPLAVRFHAVRGLGRLLTKAQVERELSPLLESAKDARVRAVAAEQLTLKSAAGCAAFKRQLAREDEAAKGLFHRAASACAPKAQSKG